MISQYIAVYDSLAGIVGAGRSLDKFMCGIVGIFDLNDKNATSIAAVLERK